MARGGSIGARVSRLANVEMVYVPTTAATPAAELVRLTPHGLDGLRRSAVIFDELRQRWTETLGADRVASIEDDLRTVTPANWFRLDIPGWFTG